MADDLKIVLGVELDNTYDEVKRKIDELKEGKDNKISIQVDTKQALEQVKAFKESLNGKTPAKIIIDVNKSASNANINAFRKGIVDKFTSNPIRMVLDVNKTQSDAKIKSYIESIKKQLSNIPIGIQPSTSSNVNGSRTSAGQNVQTTVSAQGSQAAAQIPKGYTGTTKIIQTGKMDEFEGFKAESEVEKVNLALGEQLTIYRQLNKETEELEETSRSYESNFEAQEKAREKAREATRKNYLKSVKENSKQLEYNRQAGEKAVGDIFKKELDLNRIENNAFSGTEALTGDYRTAAESKISALRTELKNLREEAEKTGKAISAETSQSIDKKFSETTNELKRLHDLQYPSDKLAAKNVDALKIDYGNRITEFQNQLKNAGQESSSFSDRLGELQKSLSSVGKIDGSGTPFAQWKSDFEQLQGEFKRWQSSPEGIAQKMSAAIDTDGIQKIKDTLSELYKLRETKDMKLPGIEDLTGQLHSLMDDYQALKEQMSGSEGPIDEESLKRLSAVYDELNQKAKDLFKEAGTYTNDDLFKKFTLDAENLQIRFDKLKQKYEDFLKAGGKRDTGLEDRFKAVQESIDNVKPGNISEVNKEMRNLGSTVSSVVTPAQSLSQVLRDNFGELGGFLARFASFTVIIQKSIQAIRSMVNEVRQLDTSLVELQKVTNLSGQSLDNFVDRAYKIGEGLGRTGKDVIDATTTFSRAGYDLQEATELAQAALVMTNVGVDIPNMEAAASDMISILRAYDKQANESMSVIDKLYNVANTQPLDFGNITDMLVTAGGTLAQTNTTLEETMALLTAGFATLRDTSVSNGLVMISQRLRGVKEDGEAIEEADFMPKLQKAFGEVGVSIQDENGELRSTYDILSDLAAVWDTLNSKQRQYLGEKAAGNRQVKVLNAIMANWDVVQNTIEAANGAADAAMVGNEKFMDSIEGRITQLQSAFQDLARTTIDSEFVKWIVSAGTKIVKFTKDAGGLIPVLTTIAGLFVAIKAESLAAGIAKLGTAFKALFSAASGGLQVFTGWVGVALAVASVVAIVSSAVNNAKKSFEDYQNEATEAQQNYEAQSEKLNTLENDLKAVSDRINELNAKDTLTVIEQDELDKLEQTNASLLTQIELQKEYRRIAETEARRAASTAISSYKNSPVRQKQGPFSFSEPEAYRKLVSVPDSGAYTIEDLKKNTAYKDIVMSQAIGDISNSDIASVYMSIMPEIKKRILQEEQTLSQKFDKERTEELNKLKDYYATAETELATYRNKLSELVANVSYVEDPQTDADLITNAVHDEIKAIDNLTLDLAATGDKQKEFLLITSRFPEIVDLIGESIENLGDITIDELQNFPDLMQAFADKGWTPEDVAAHFNEIYAAVQEGEGQVTGPATTPATELSSSVFANTENYQKVLSKAISEQDKSGVLSSETWANLLAVLPEVSDYLALTANGYMLNTEALYGYIDAQNEYAKLEAVKGLIEQQKALEELTKEADKYSDEQEYINAQNAIQKEIDQYSAVIREIDAATGALARYRAAKETQNQDTDFNEGQNAYKDLTEGWKSGKVGTDDFKSSLGFFLGDNWEETYKGDLEKAYKAAEEIGKKYFGQDDERKGMLNYAKDLEEKGFGKFEGDNFELFSTRQLENGEEVAVTIQDIAKELGISEDAANSLFGLMETYGAEFERPEIVTEEDKKLAEQLAEIEAQKAETEQNIVDLQEEQKTIGEEQGEDSEAYKAKTKEIEEQSAALEVLNGQADEVAKQLTSGEPVEPPLSLEDAKAKLAELDEQIKTLQDAGVSINAFVEVKNEQLMTFVEEVESGKYDKEAKIVYTTELGEDINEQLGGRPTTKKPPTAEEIAEQERQRVLRQLDTTGTPGTTSNLHTKKSTVDLPSPRELVEAGLGRVNLPSPSELKDYYSNGNEPIEITATVEPEENSANKIVEDLNEQLDRKNNPVEVPTEPETNNRVSLPSPSELVSTTSSPAAKTLKEQQLDIIVQPNTESEQAAIDEMQTEADNNPIEITMETVNQANKGALNLVNQTRESGIEGAEEEVKSLQEASMGLSLAMQNLENANPFDPEEWEAASAGLDQAAINFSNAYNNLSAKVSAVQTVSVDANTSKAIQKIDKLSERKVTVTVDATTTGPQNAKGTRNASAGPSLVDERGAELIEHTSRGTFELGTNNGPRFTTLDKGDVVHTAEETKRIMSRLGKIGGFFRDGLNKVKSVFTGGAHATGISGSMSWSLINKTLKKVQSSGSGSSSSTSKSSSKSKNSTKNISKWAEKLFDWAEIRLERLQTITNTWLLSAAEAIGYIAKNKELENAIASVENQISDTTAAYDLYMNQADEVAKRSNLSEDIVQKIKDGSIEISEYDKKMQDVIKEYIVWHDKALDCVDALSDLREQEKELAAQKLDNIITMYDNRVRRIDNIVGQREAELELLSAQGAEIQASEYDVAITQTAIKLQELVAERDALNQEMTELMARGLIEKESETWYDYMDKIDGVEQSITETKTAIIELQDTVNNLTITKLGYQLDAITSSADRMTDMMNLHAKQGLDEVSDAYRDLILNGMEQIDNLERQNKELREQQKGLDVLSEKYQDLENQIQQNISTINKMKVSQEEWNDSVLDLKIAQLQKYKDSLNKVNDQYQRQKELQEAIEELEKAQNQRTQRIFKDGVGFVYESDQQALKDAQENLENVIENQLLSKVDDLISALEDMKNDTNVYDANGNLLGSEYVIPQLGTLSQILDGYYNSSDVPMFSGLRGSLYDQIVSGAISNNASTQITIGDINLSEVNDVNTLGEAIVDLLPNAILQAINKKNS